MKKILITLAMMFMLPTIVLAAEIDLSVDKTSISTDDVTRISVSISGPVDGGQVGIAGLENFDIVGQQSSQSIQMINGQTAQVEKKEITVRPKKSGSFTVKALARDNGTEISSKDVTINVQKSQLDTTKDELLQGSSQQNTQTSPSQDTQNNSSLDDAISTQKPISDFDEDLLKKSQVQSDDNIAVQSEESDGTEQLQTKQIENFPKVEHLSPFNMIFWAEFIGIILGVVAIVTGMLWFIRKLKK